MRTTLLLIIAIFTTTMLNAQGPVSTNWFTVQLPVVFNNHWQWNNEFSYRTLGERAAMNQLFLRTGARYRFNEKWSVSGTAELVYTRLSPVKTEDRFGRESRLVQEANLQLPLKNKYSFINRLRIEERMFSETPKRAAFNAVRFRYRTGFEKRISGQWSLQLTDELMEQLQSGKIGFNQNRASLAAICELPSNMRLQGAYIWAKSSVFSQHIFSIVFQKRIMTHARRNQG